MKLHWFEQSAKRELLVFFGGWGTDPRPFGELDRESWDVLMLYAYDDLVAPVDLTEVGRRYEVVHLVAWSLGVAVCETVCGKLAGLFTTAVAINGTPVAIDSRLGIPAELFDGTIENLDHGGLARFKRRMCGNRGTLQRYDRFSPQRSIADLKRELVFLRHNLPPSPPRQSVFQRAFTGKGDRIVPPENQRRCWNRLNVPCSLIDAPHFPFFVFSSWEELLHAANH